MTLPVRWAETRVLTRNFEFVCESFPASLCLYLLRLGLENFELVRKNDENRRGRRVQSVSCRPLSYWLTASSGEFTCACFRALFFSLGSQGEVELKWIQRFPILFLFEVAKLTEKTIPIGESFVLRASSTADFDNSIPMTPRACRATINPCVPVPQQRSTTVDIFLGASWRLTVS